MLARQVDSTTVPKAPVGPAEREVRLEPQPAARPMRERVQLAYPRKVLVRQARPMKAPPMEPVVKRAQVHPTWVQVLRTHRRAEAPRARPTTALLPREGKPARPMTERSLEVRQQAKQACPTCPDPVWREKLRRPSRERVE
jgi:hypothetical protein